MVFLPWKILHLDLHQSVPDLPAMPGYQGLYLMFWWQGIPLGHREILAAQLPMPASQLMTLALQSITPTVGSHLLQQGFRAPLPELPRKLHRDQPPPLPELLALQQPLRQLQERWEQASELQETVSVVVCTRDRPEQLARCLQSLRSLAIPPHEILVIDNAPSSDATLQLVAQMPNIRYIPELKPGLSNARNAGIRYATGQLIAFTDDDVEVHPYWIAQLRQAFRDPEVMAMTGLIVPARLDTEAEVVFQQGSNGFGWGYRPLRFDQEFFQTMKLLGVPVWRIGAGANMAFRRSIFAVLGEFDPRLGAGASGCSEDSEFWYRVLASGYQCYYQPTAVVYHYHRSNLNSLRQQMYAYMRGHVAALLVQFERHTHWGNLLRLLIVIPLYYTKRLILACMSGFQGSYRTLLTEMRGCLAGIVFYLRHRSRPIANPPRTSATSHLNLHSHQSSQL